MPLHSSVGNRTRPVSKTKQVNKQTKKLSRGQSSLKVPMRSKGRLREVKQLPPDHTARKQGAQIGSWVSCLQACALLSPSGSEKQNNLLEDKMQRECSWSVAGCPSLCKTPECPLGCSATRSSKGKSMQHPGKPLASLVAQPKAVWPSMAGQISTVLATKNAQKHFLLGHPSKLAQWEGTPAGMGSRFKFHPLSLSDVGPLARPLHTSGSQCSYPQNG